ncbi:YihY/virulence factor BrkB family protein [Cryptosporangium aurantiacum]|uniref:YihY/virulence factor BrkB family protein n=1 Tax=Cryptosporangium aurantiacum TaxID=134849 RepID=UPI0009330120|nr:YihY/virulence factor BrkB family protein [Cryptosporangium aurantiacum]
MRTTLSGIWRVIRSMLAKAWQDRILGLSAEAAFWQLLSVPPLFLAILGVLGYAGRWTGTDLVNRTEAHALRLTDRLVSPSVQHDVVAPIVGELLRHGRGEVATIALVLSLWAGSSSTATFVNTVSIAYGQRELRGAVASRLLALWLYIFTLATAVVAVPLAILGPDFVVAWLPDGWHSAAEAVIRLAYWPVTAGIVFTALSAFYHYATPVRLRWRRALPGAALALLLFIGLSWVLRLYLGRLAGEMLLFSTLAAPIVALLYFYVLAFAVLLGAELNGTLEQLHPAGRRPRHLHRIARLGRKLAAAFRGRRPAEDPPAEPEPEAESEPDEAKAPVERTDRTDAESARSAAVLAHSPLGSES